MTSFTLEQLQRISDIYASFVRVRKVNIHLVKRNSKFKKRMGGSYGLQSDKPRKIFIIPRVLTLSRQAQLCLIIHELCHFNKRRAHAKSWKNAAYLWGSAYQMRHVRSDEEVKRHIAGGCKNLDTWITCDECPQPRIRNPPGFETCDVVEVAAGEFELYQRCKFKNCEVGFPVDQKVCPSCGRQVA